MEFDLDENTDESEDGESDQSDGHDEKNPLKGLGLELMMMFGDIIGQDRIPDESADPAGEGE